jgi:gliding motility-associated-like protein
LTRKTTVLTGLFTLFAFITYAQVPSANFTAATTSGCSPLVVDFQDQSTGSPTSWLWDFGNGATSTLQNPSTTYFNPGTYTIRLTVTNANGTNTITRSDYIVIYGKPVVNFTVSDSVACFPHRAQFTDLSTAATGTINTSWLWDFGDGTQSTQQNPLHIYTTSGTYTVTLKLTNDKGCFSVRAKTAYIQVSGGVVADFTNTQPNVCKPPFNVSFTNNSTGPGTLSYFWDFGDGNTSTQVNPNHTYTSTGTYTVSMAVTSTNGCSDTLRRVNLFSFQNITTSFTAPDSICVNSVVNFNNTSTPTPASAVWDFGDAATSTQINPAKVYTTVGTYTIRLTNKYSYCSDTASRIIRVLPRPVANFNATNTTRCQPSLTTNFQDLSSNAISWLWDFGDGNTSTQQNPSHTYTSYGTFNVVLIVTNTSGCTDTIRRNGLVQIIRPQITFLSLPVQGCIPYTINPVANITTLDAVTSYLWDFGDGTTSTAVNPSHTYSVQGTYTVKLYITTSSGCTDSIVLPAAVRVGRKPVVNFNAVPNPVCAFQQVQFTDLTNEGDQWLWLFGDGGSSSQQNPLYQYSDTGLFDVTLFVTNNGCRDSLRISDFIRIKPPIADFGFSTNCNNRLQFTFLDSSIGATTWFWDFGDGTTSTLQNPVHNFPGYGNYNVTLTVTNDTCSHTIARVINVINEIPDFIADRTVACRPAIIQFNVTNVNTQNIVSYSWDFGNGTLYTTTGTVVGDIYNNSGYYTVRLTSTDIYGCQYQIVKPNYIRINGPVADFTATNTAGCRGLTTTFNDLSRNDGISNIVSWRWDFGDGTIQTFTGGPFTHTYNTAGTFTVKLVVTDAGGCTDSLIRQNLVVATDPIPDFVTADTLTCPGRTVNFTNNSTAINYTSYWDLGNGTTSTLQSPSNVYTNTGLYTIKLRITDQYGCSDSLTKPLYVRVDLPVAGFTVNDSISACTPFEVQFTNTSQYYISSLWNLGGGTSTMTNPIQYYSTPGVYPIQLIVTSPGGCQDTATGNITVYDTIGTRIDYSPLNGCKPLGVALQAFTNAPMTYTWDFGDGVLINTTNTSLNHTYNFFGDFIPKVIMTDPAGCIIPVTGADTIRIIGATVDFGLDRRLFCDSGLVRFTDSTTNNDPIVRYEWDFGDGTISNLQHPTHQYTAPGFYTVMLNVTTQAGCVDTMRLPNVIKVAQSPDISVAGDSIICINEFIDHLGVFERLDTGMVQWSWQFPNGNTGNVQNPPGQQYTTAGTFFVNTRAVNSDGCFDTVTKRIIVNPLPVITMPSTITMQSGFPVTIPATYSSNVATWMWQPNATLSCADCPQPVASPKFNTKYRVDVVDSNGCANRSEIQVIVICKNANVFLPNTFSPNGDGSNDMFYIRGRGLDRVKSLRIFNRWGEVVFEQQNFPVNNPLYGWNGKHKGNKPHPDVYVYQVEVFCENSQIIRFEGNVALIQ